MLFMLVVFPNKTLQMLETFTDQILIHKRQNNGIEHISVARHIVISQAVNSDAFRDCEFSTKLKLKFES